MSSRPRRGNWLTRIGLVFLLVGLSLLGWVGWQYFGTNVVSNRAMKQEVTDLREAWKHEAGADATDDAAPRATRTATTGTARTPGNGATKAADANTTDAGDQAAAASKRNDVVALLRIPKLGSDWEKPVIAGTTDKQLARGIGHYNDTAAPGAIGNFALAGHVVTHGSPFRHLKKLQKGDLVHVETRTMLYTYVMDTSPADLTVDESDGRSLYPVPNRPNVKPTKALITLTTCTDLFHSPRRSIGFGHLAKTERKA